MPGLLSRERTVARPGFNRWLAPPAALAIHLSIGMAYGFSVFWLPLSRAIGINDPIPCPKDMSFLATLVADSCDWKVSTLGWIFTLFFVFLGSSAAVFGNWLERAGPRKAGIFAALCWSGGFMLSALGIYLHQIWMLWLGSGVIGGCGLGLGYISPVSTLIKWFPDRRGLATGMAIMGFGGGAMIGSPLADKLMKYFQTSTSVGVMETFITLGLIYFIAMLCGAFAYRVPPEGWQPAGWTPPAPKDHAMMTRGNVHLYDAHKTPQFWLLWGVLCLNVSAGIGVLGMASPMLQEVFGGKLIGAQGTLASLDKLSKEEVATMGAAFAALLSLFNIAGRIFWASLSDYLGRKLTYFIFFMLGIWLYTAVPFAGHWGKVGLFVALFSVILSMYGGGFATIPAYLADLFGTRFVGAIHGRLLTAWSVAGILGPVLVNYIREFQIDRGVPRAEAYSVTMFILAGLLWLGLFCNLAVRPVAKRFFMPKEQNFADDKPVGVRANPGPNFSASTDEAHPSPAGWILVALSWLLVGMPLVWGVSVTLEKAAKLFR